MRPCGFYLKKKNGQSIVELAIFGTIVIFVIGLIFKNTLNASHNANMELRTFRRALRESYQTADGKYAGEFSGGRNNASFIILEDRLAIDPSSKQGTRDRAPYMAQGSGTMTHTLFMPIKETDTYDLPVYDFIINGQRFPFSTGRVVTKDLTAMYQDGLIPDCGEAGSETPGYGKVTGTCRNRATGKFVFFRQEYNGGPGWGIGTGPWTYDLNFDGIEDVGALTTVPYRGAAGGNKKNLREEFMWQWVKVEQSALRKDMMVDIDGDRKEEKILDINGDRIQVYDSQEGDFNLTVDEGAKQWYVEWRNWQSAIDPDFVGPLELRSPGLEKDLRVYSFTYAGDGKTSGDGTYLENREGKLYSLDGQFVRNETSQDHLDIIERVLRVNNDTGRFCSIRGGGTPCGSSSTCDPTTTWNKANGLHGLTNPVERCNDCFSYDNRKYTCMDTDNLVIFVRSRIRDRRRTRWITRTESKK